MTTIVVPDGIASGEAADVAISLGTTNL